MSERTRRTVLVNWTDEEESLIRRGMIEASNALGGSVLVDYTGRLSENQVEYIAEAVTLADLILPMSSDRLAARISLVAKCRELRAALWRLGVAADGVIADSAILPSPAEPTASP